LTVKQADDINNIFEKQKATIAALKLNIATRDSLIAAKEIILLEKTQVIENFVFDTVIAKRLDIIEHWILDAGINSTWIYYSWEDSTEDQVQPPKGWETDIVKPRRPRVTKVPIKM